MTRWKREPTTTIVLMHAHNQWSHWRTCLLNAADDLGLPVGEANYPNCSGDGSWDQEFYTLSSALNRAGGIDKLHHEAAKLHEDILMKEPSWF